MVAQTRFTSGGVQQLRGSNVGVEIAKGQNIERAARTISGTADKAMNMFQDLEQNQNTADMSINYSKEMVDAGKDPYISTARALELGANDDPSLYTMDDEGDQVEREDINIDEVMPEIAKAKYDRLTDKYGANISGGGNRQEWINRRRVAGEEMYQKLDEERNATQFKRMVDKYDSSIEMAKEAGDYSLALTLIDNHPTQDLVDKDKLMLGVRKASELNDVHTTIQNGNPADMMALAQQYRDEEFDGSFHGEPEQTAFVNLLEQSARSIVNAEKTARIKYIDSMNERFEVQMALKDSAGAMESLMTMQMYLEETGEVEYFDKQFFPARLGRITAMGGDIANYEDQRAAFLSAYSTEKKNGLDPTDKDTQDNLNAVVNTSIAEANEMDRQGGGGQYTAAAHQGMIKSSSATGFMPDFYEEKFDRINNGFATPEEVVEASVYYAEFAEQAPYLLGRMSDTAKAQMERVRGVNLAGMDPTKALEGLHTIGQTQTPETQQHLAQQWNKIQLSSNGQYVSNSLKTKVSKSDRWAFSPGRVWDEFAQDSSDMGIPADMEVDYSSLVEHYYTLNGGVLAEAENAAYNDLTKTWQPSGVNAQQRWMRRSPEIAYNMESADINHQRNLWLSENVEEFSWAESSRYMLVDDLQSTTETQPRYTVWYLDSNDIPRPVGVDGTDAVRWRPNPQQAYAEQRKIDMRNAEIEDQIEKLGYQASTRVYGGGQDQRSRERRYRDSGRVERYEQRKVDAADTKTRWADKRAKQTQTDRSLISSTGLNDE